MRFNSASIPAIARRSETRHFFGSVFSSATFRSNHVVPFFDPIVFLIPPVLFLM
jgi:hypothetical protein